MRKQLPPRLLKTLGDQHPQELRYSRCFDQTLGYQARALCSRGTSMLPIGLLGFGFLVLLGF